jgi:hypothetical protein
MDNTFYRESDSDSDSEFEWDNSDEKSKKIFLNDQPQSQIKEKLDEYRDKLQYNRVIIDNDTEQNNDKLVFKNIVSFNIEKIFVSAVTTSADGDIINSIQYFDIIIPELQDCIKIKHASIDGIITRIYNNKFSIDSATATAAAAAAPEESNIKNFFTDKVDDPTLHLNIPTTINFNTLKIFIKVKKVKYEATSTSPTSPSPVFSKGSPPPFPNYKIDESITKQTIQDLYKKNNIIISLQIGFYTKPS